MSEDYMEKLLSGEWTPDRFRAYVMANVPPKITQEEQEENRRHAEDYRHISSFEDIHPTEDTNQDSELFITGRLNSEEYQAYLGYKYGEFEG